MTIPKEAIEKATAGGWNNFYQCDSYSNGHAFKIALDPLFWLLASIGQEPGVGIYKI